MITVAQFRARFAEFADVSDAQIQVFINDADQAFDECRWGGMYERGMANYVAHLAALFIRRNVDPERAAFAGIAGFSGQKAGDLSYTVDGGFIERAGKNPFLSTEYGIEYLYLSKHVGLGAVAV